MRDEQDRDRAFERVIEHEPPHVVPQLGIELVERFVEEQRARFGEQRAHQRDARALAARQRRRIALVATFAPTLASMPAEFPNDVEIVPVMVEGAMAALDRGDGDAHDRLAAEAVARAVTMPVDAVALSQFSLARAAEAVSRATSAPVLTTPVSAVRALRARLRAR